MTGLGSEDGAADGCRGRLARCPSRHWRPLRRDALYRALGAPRRPRGSCSWVRLGGAAPWPGADLNAAVLLVLVDLGVLDLKQEAGEAVFVRRSDPAAGQRLRRLRELVAEHDAHGWPSDDVLEREVRGLFAAPQARGEAR